MGAVKLLASSLSSSVCACAVGASHDSAKKTAAAQAATLEAWCFINPSIEK
jgi:hypothetical protein